MYFQNHKPKRLLLMIFIIRDHFTLQISIYVQDYKPKSRFSVIFIPGHHFTVNVLIYLHNYKTKSSISEVVIRITNQKSDFQWFSFYILNAQYFYI